MLISGQIFCFVFLLGNGMKHVEKWKSREIFFYPIEKFWPQDIENFRSKLFSTFFLLGNCIKHVEKSKSRKKKFCPYEKFWPQDRKFLVNFFNVFLLGNCMKHVETWKSQQQKIALWDIPVSDGSSLYLIELEIATPTP